MKVGRGSVDTGTDGSAAEVYCIHFSAHVSEAQDVSFNSDSDPVAFFCCAIFLSTTEFFFAHILLKKAFCYDTILKI